MGIPYPKMEIGLFLILGQTMHCQQEKFIKQFLQQLHLVHCTLFLIVLTRLIYTTLSYMQMLIPSLAMGYGLDIIAKLRM